jgi:hypothetical protein
MKFENSITKCDEIRKKIIEVIQKAVRDGVEKNQKAADTAS